MSSSTDQPSDPKYSKLAFIAHLKIDTCDVAIWNTLRVGRSSIALKASGLRPAYATHFYQKLNNTKLYLDLSTGRDLFVYRYDAVHGFTTAYFALILAIAERLQSNPAKGPPHARSPPQPAV